MKTKLIAWSLWAACAAAQAGVIDFNGDNVVCSATVDGNGATGVCGNYSYIAQSYGDVAGVLDVQYSAPRLSDPHSLRWWDASYNNLRGVAWADVSDADSRARIDLKPLNGQAVTLTHFDIGAYPSTTRYSTVTVSAIGGPVLFSYGGNVGIMPANLATSFDGNWSSSTGIRIEWADSAYNSGIDNISYRISPVPEPAVFLMMLAGLVLLGGVAKRERSDVFTKED